MGIEMKKLLTAFALAATVGLTACASEEADDDVIIETDPLEQPAPPVTTPPPPTTTPPMGADTMGGMPMDTAAPAAP
jgi:hypothetical protein